MMTSCMLPVPPSRAAGGCHFEGASARTRTRPRPGPAATLVVFVLTCFVLQVACQCQCTGHSNTRTPLQGAQMSMLRQTHSVRVSLTEAHSHACRALSALLTRGALDARPSVRWPNLRVTRVHMRRPCGRSSSPLSAMAAGRTAEARSHYERASSALLARSYAHSVHVC